jgi:hypothetical protein
MVHTTQGTVSTGFTQPALLRWLAQFTPPSDAHARDPGRATADRLSQWLRWTDAISLAGALNANPPAARPNARSNTPAGTSTEEQECAGLRAALAKTIAEDRAAPADDFPTYRRRYHARQQTMETAIGAQRERLRASLAARSPAMAQLAAVDAVMEQTLSEREHSLLASVPTALDKHFARLRRAGQATNESDKDKGNAAQPAPWLDAFHKDFLAVCLAELDFRMQPLEGLLDALRTR